MPCLPQPPERPGDSAHSAAGVSAETLRAIAPSRSTRCSRPLPSLARRHSRPGRTVSRSWRHRPGSPWEKIMEDPGSMEDLRGYRPLYLPLSPNLPRKYGLISHWCANRGLMGHRDVRDNSVARSAPGEGRLSRAVLEEAAHAGALVLGGEQGGELDPFELQAGGQVRAQAGVDGL